MSRRRVRFVADSRLMNTRTFLAACGIALATTSCADFSGFKRDSSEQATDEDKQEAQYLRDLLNAGEVVPGVNFTSIATVGIRRA